MANRAYLFCSDCDPDDPLTWVDLNVNKQYYDSRHDIPLSWFFFFRPDDVKLIDVFFTYGNPKISSYWQEPKFMVDKKQALDIFRSREALLAQIVGPNLYTKAFGHFLPRLQQIPGNCLCMDPGAIAQGDEEDYLPLKKIVELISDKTTPYNTLIDSIQQFTSMSYEDENDYVLHVIGYTYGDIYQPDTGDRAIPS